MQKYDSLKNIIAIVGENELSPVDRADYQNAKKLIEFFNQDFSVAEKFSGRPGQYFTIEQTLDGIEAILEGKEVPGAKPADAKTEDKKDGQPAAPAEGQAAAANTQPTEQKPAEDKDKKDDSKDKKKGGLRGLAKAFHRG